MVKMAKLNSNPIKRSERLHLFLCSRLVSSHSLATLFFDSWVWGQTQIRVAVFGIPVTTIKTMWFTLSEFQYPTAFLFTDSTNSSENIYTMMNPIGPGGNRPNVSDGDIKLSPPATQAYWPLFILLVFFLSSRWDQVLMGLWVEWVAWSSIIWTDH